VHETRIARLEGAEHLERIVFRDGTVFECRGLFLSTGQRQRSDLAASLGCAFTREGAVRTGKIERTKVRRRPSIAFWPATTAGNIFKKDRFCLCKAVHSFVWCFEIRWFQKV
jgi:hypothetical protein